VQDLEADQRKLGVRLQKKNYQTRQLRKDDAMDYRKWRQLIKDIV